MNGKNKKYIYITVWPTKRFLKQQNSDNNEKMQHPDFCFLNNFCSFFKKQQQTVLLGEITDCRCRGKTQSVAMIYFYARKQKHTQRLMGSYQGQRGWPNGHLMDKFGTILTSKKLTTMSDYNYIIPASIQIYLQW